MLTPNNRLHALIVDTEPDMAEIIGNWLGLADIKVTFAESFDQARAVINNLIIEKVPLNFITTGLLMAPAPWGGLDLIKYIRNLPDEVVIDGGFRLRHLPIAIVTACQHLRDYVASIDPDISYMEKPLGPDEFFAGVGETLRKYRHNLLQDCQRAGLAFFWKEGKFRVAQAINVKAHETKYWCGGMFTATSSYTRLMLVLDGWLFAQSAITTLEALLNDTTTDERDLQSFFNCHPEFLGHGYDTYWSEPRLKHQGSGRIIRPDFILQPRGLRERVWKWKIVDLKLPSAPLINKGQFHPTLSSQVYRLAGQLKDYGQFFNDPQNKELLRNRFGNIIPQPQLTGVIGRLPPEQIEQFSELRDRLGGVTITTYDELLESRRATVEWFRGLH
jgi:DNA-binding response OmpR family regulator